MNIHSAIENMTVAFVSLGDATDPNYSSGSPYGMRQGFLDIGCNVIDVFPVRPRMEHIFLPKRIAHRLRGVYYSGDREALCLRLMARTIERAVERHQPDFVFAAHSIPLTKFKSKLPTVLSHDQSFIERMDYFPYEARFPAPSYAKQAIDQELQAFNNASLCIYPSYRSLETIEQEYGISPRKLAMIPWGANLPFEPSQRDVEGMIGKRQPDLLNLLFIGVDWERKGGDDVIAACNLLQQRGVALSLTIIGSSPKIDLPGYVTVIPYFDKQDPAQLSAYLDIIGAAHLLFVPSRAEAYGHVFCEAAAYGVPSVARDVGGISTIIVDGVTGCCLPADAGPADFADAIQAAFKDSASYSEMALAARRRYEEVLNWRSFSRSVVARVAEFVEA